MSNIKFGTDGWRAVLDKDFTETNVKRVTLAVGKYVADNFGFEKPIKTPPRFFKLRILICLFLNYP